MDTTAIIQFIGIVLFSAAIPQDPGVHAILPRIEAQTHAEHYVNPGDAKQDAQMSAMGVQEHVAVILYRDEDVISRGKGWRRTGSLKNGWEFVELDGEQVQFLTNTENAQPTIPGDIPRAVMPTSRCLLSSIKPVGFKDEFQGPDYKGAVAVVDIPSGKLSACAARTRDESNRVDTTLLLNTDGVLFIAAKKSADAKAKTLALDGDAIVYVANVPPHYLFTGIAEPPTGEAHSEAYRAMLDTPCHDGPESGTAAAICDLSAINTAWKVAQAKPPSPDLLKIIDAGCSNTQWP
jgi:hypothetical protein